MRDRTAQLDWSAVVSASDESLNVLLAGLDLSDDADVLGDSTLSETIASKIVQVLQEQPEPVKTQQSKPTEPKITPAIWQQSNLLQPQFVATNEEQGEGQGNLIEMHGHYHGRPRCKEQPQ